MQIQNEIDKLPDVLVMLAAAVVVVATFRQFKLSPVLGFLVAGALIGPYGFGYVKDTGTTAYLAEFGVVFMLFVIGLELSFKKLFEMRAYVLGLGSLQLLITAAAITYVTYIYLPDFKAAVIIGSALALSSTAIVLQILDERGERSSQTGRVSFSILLFQDLAVIPLLVVLPIIAGDNPAATGKLVEHGVQALVAIFILMTIGKVALKPVLSIIAGTKSQELFIATTLLLVLGGAYITEHAGLSQALGAFIAGLFLAETEFRKQVEIDVSHFKGLLLGLFFMSVGMQFDANELVNKLPVIVPLSLGLIAIKTVIIMLLCLAFKMRLKSSIKIGLLMSQGSEFAFILFGLATSNGLFSSAVGQTLLLVVSFTMALTPLMFSLVSFYYNRVSSTRRQKKYGIKETEDLKGHFIICGFGWVGENLAKLLSTEGFSFVAIDQEPKRVKMGRDLGLPVYYGDASRPEVLNSLNVGKARAIIITMHDSRPVLRIIETLKKSFADKTIICRAKHVDNVELMRNAGADIVVPEAYESSIQIAKTALKLHGLPDFDIELIADNYRQSLEPKEVEEEKK